jgi:hypothetical protein
MGVIANKIPEKTTPLTKFIRTGEGVLVFAFNLTMLIVPIVSNALSPEDAVKWAGIVNGVAVISRTGLKIVAQVSKATGIEPQPIGDQTPQPSSDETPQVATADAGGAANNGGAPEVVDPSDSEEFASTPTADDDAVEVPPTPVVTAPPVVVTPPEPVITPPPVVVTPPATVQTAAADSTDPQVSDEEEFADVPPASDDDGDGIVAGAVSDDDDQTDAPEPVGAGAAGVPNPTVINGGEAVS